MAGKGSAKGERRGGRTKGVPNKKTQEMISKAVGTGKTPLDIILSAMHSADAEDRTDDAVRYAEKAAPYVHAKLQATTIKGDAENPLVIASKEQRDAVVAAAYALDSTT